MSDIVKEARKLYEKDKEAWSSIYKLAKEDLQFQSDDEYAQWDQTDAQRRRETGRPAITVDKLTQFVHQVANDIRMNTPTINVIPSDEAGSIETADVFKGKIKDIEYRSGADDAYDTAVTSAIKCSIGFIRVDHDYADEKSDKQELFIKRVVNPFAVILDSDSTESDGSDAMHGFVLDKMSAARFKEKYPGKEVHSFEDEECGNYKDSDDVYVAEFIKIVETPRKIGFLEDGTSEDVAEGKEYKTTRTTKDRVVTRYILSGKEVLEETRFPGKYVPIVPVYGEEAWEDGKRKLHSLIRKAKPAQRMHNYWASLETELLMKQPQAPVMAPIGAVEDFVDEWKDPNKAMVLRYNTELNGKPLPKPERLSPPQVPTGILNARMVTVDDIKGAMGIYNASLGERSNETSGVAINQRKIEGDVATYHFGDNLVKSITQVGRILVCAIPEIYDTPRVIRTIGEDDEPKPVGINGAMIDGQDQTYDLRQGKYDVRVITGAPFTTRRQETAAALTQMFGSNPELMTVFGDIFFKNSDFAGAQAMAERAEKLLPPNLKDEEDDQEKIALQQQLQEAAQQIEALSAQLKNRSESDMLKASTDKMKAETDLQQAKIDAAVKMAELKVREQEIALKQQENQLKALEIQARLSRPPEDGQSSPLN